MPEYGGWYARRRGLLEHLDKGTISLLDSGIHDFLCLLANHKNGVARASAAKIRSMCPSEINLRQIQRSLAWLEELGWIKRFRGKNRRGNYEILIARFFVKDAEGTWWSTNIERTTSPRDVQFDRVTDPSFVSNSVCQAKEAVTRNEGQVSHEMSHEPVTRSETVSAEEESPCDECQDDAVTHPGHTRRLEVVTPNSCDLSPLQDLRLKKEEFGVGCDGNGTSNYSAKENALEKVFEGFDLPEDGKLHVNRDLINSLAIDARRLTDEERESLGKFNRPWKRACRGIQNTEELIVWLEEAIGRMRQSKMPYLRVLDRRLHDLREGRLSVESPSRV
jgi:hypothetical protein